MQSEIYSILKLFVDASVTSGVSIPSIPWSRVQTSTHVNARTQSYPSSLVFLRMCLISMIPLALASRDDATKYSSYPVHFRLTFHLHWPRFIVKPPCSRYFFLPSSRVSTILIWMIPIKIHRENCAFAIITIHTINISVGYKFVRSCISTGVVMPPKSEITKETPNIWHWRRRNFFMQIFLSIHTYACLPPICVDVSKEPAQLGFLVLTRKCQR